MEPLFWLQVAFVTAVVSTIAEFTVTVRVALAVQPLASVTVTVYVVVEAGFTVIKAVVAPVLHT